MSALTNGHRNQLAGLGIVLALTLCGAGVLSLGAAAAGSGTPAPARRTATTTTVTTTTGTSPAVPPSRPAKATPRAEIRSAGCTAVRTAGTGPIRRGEPGYRRALDRDGDGLACEN